MADSTFSASDLVSPHSPPRVGPQRAPGWRWRCGRASAPPRHSRSSSPAALSPARLEGSLCVKLRNRWFFLSHAQKGVCVCGVVCFYGGQAGSFVQGMIRGYASGV